MSTLKKLAHVMRHNIHSRKLTNPHSIIDFSTAQGEN